MLWLAVSAPCLKELTCPIFQLRAEVQYMNTDGQSKGLILWGPLMYSSTHHTQIAQKHSEHKVTIAFQDHALMNKIYKGDLSKILSNVLTKVK